MIKLRLQGTREEIQKFSRWLSQKKKIDILSESDLYSNKGTTRYFRKYFDVEIEEKGE